MSMVSAKDEAPLLTYLDQAELPTCTHLVYFVHKNDNMKFVDRIQAFVHIKIDSCTVEV